MIFTDGDKAMASALKTSWPSVHHSWCSWHFLRNILKSLSGYFGKHTKEFYGLFRRIMYQSDSRSINTFDKEFAELITGYCIPRAKSITTKAAAGGRHPPEEEYDRMSEDEIHALINEYEYKDSEPSSSTTRGREEDESTTSSPVVVPAANPSGAGEQTLDVASIAESLPYCQYLVRLHHTTFFSSTVNC